MIVAYLLLAFSAGPSLQNIESQQLRCWTAQIDAQAEKGELNAQLHLLTKWESVRLLWSAAGDAEACKSIDHPASNDVMNSAYRHAASVVVKYHLFRRKS